MNTLKNYYGLIIRSNVGNLYQMKKGIAAILFHCSECFVPDSEDNIPDYATRHQYCPIGEGSWCKYQRDQATGASTYKTKINIPKAVCDIIKPIFSHTDLGSDVLLKKCLHGQTQNSNESFNNCIWRKAPKDVFVARKTLEIAVASAVIHFNDGGSGMLKLIEKCGFLPGHYTVMGCAQGNQDRVRSMNIKTSTVCKQRRKTVRAVRKGWRDKENSDDKSYSSGAF